MNDPILDNLNEQQYAAVTAPDGPLLIVAGAGTGKTRVITRRLALLVRDRGIRPYQIFAATFTNKAAQEMKHRTSILTDGICSPDFHISTFHSLCARILRREAVHAGLDPSFTICDDRDQISAIKHVMKKLGIEERLFKPSDSQFVINQCKMRMMGPDKVEEFVALNQDEHAEVFAAYLKYLSESNAVDFEDLILRVVQLFQDAPAVLHNYQNRYRHIMVDEYQDTNSVQVELISLLAKEHRNLAVVGDEDQSIYSWRGADITNILEFQNHFPDASVIRLERNYRSTGNILKAASTVIGNNKDRLGKTLFTEDDGGAPIYALSAGHHSEEASAVMYAIEELTRSGRYLYSDIAIFYRVGALARIFEDRLREFRIPYRIIGGVRFYDRAEIKDLISYLQVACNPGNSIALLRIINNPRRGIGDKTLQTVIDLAGREGVSIYEGLSIAINENLIPRAAAGKLGNFIVQIAEWKRASATTKPSELYQRILDETGYIAALGNPKNLEVLGRTENLEELLNSIVQYEKEHPSHGLTEYLENVSLVNATDDLDPNEQAVNLMTLHAAKGLEYKIVFMIGMEDGIFPSLRAVSEKGDYEEERRLFYVGITRAREVLVLSHAQSRIWYGETRYNRPSGFLTEIPEEIVRPLDMFNPIFHSNLDEAPMEAASPDLPTPQARPTYRSRNNFEDSPFLQRPPVQSRPAPSAIRAELPSRARGVSLGKRVRHPLLGEGVVAAVSGQGSELTLVLHLDDGSEHHLLARYARLEVLDNEV